MHLNAANLGALLMLTFRNPRRTAQLVLNLQVPLAARWIGLLLVSVMSALLLHISFALQPSEIQGAFGPLMVSPMVSAGFQAAVLLITTVAVYQIGRAFGGQGRFYDALLLIVWLQFVLICVQVVQVVMFLVLPLAADVLGLVALALFFWLLTNFVAELHGFASLAMAFLGILVAMVAMAFLLAFLLALILGPRMGG